MQWSEFRWREAIEVCVLRPTLMVERHCAEYRIILIVLIVEPISSFVFRDLGSQSALFFNTLLCRQAEV